MNFDGIKKALVQKPDRDQVDRLPAALYSDLRVSVFRELSGLKVFIMYFFAPTVHLVFLVLGNVTMMLVGLALFYMSTMLHSAIGECMVTGSVVNTVYGFYACSVLVTLTSFIGFMACCCRSSWPFPLYIGLLGTLMMVEIGVSGSGYLIPLQVRDELKVNCGPDKMDLATDLAELDAQLLFFIVIFQILLSWSAYNYYAHLMCFHGKQGYDFEKQRRPTGNPKSPEVFTYHPAIVYKPTFGEKTSTPIWPMYTPTNHSGNDSRLLQVNGRKHVIRFADEVSNIIGEDSPLPEITFSDSELAISSAKSNVSTP
ncbi:hypothetical protein HDE_08163 [Halotydeus destructor]|nr:hypothetical protein HDE_08163 [Halotydeus destructor]